MGPSWEKTIRGVTGDTWGQKGKQGVDGAVDVPGVHVGGGGHDLGGAHLLHALQRLLSLGSVQVGVGTLTRNLGNFDQLLV